MQIDLNNQEKGKKGEDLAQAFLEKKGYTLVAKNWRKAPYELDLVMEDGKTLVIVEVKLRSSSFFGNPETFVTKTKQRHLAKGAQLLIREHPPLGEVRFDVVAITLVGNDSKIFHLEDAFYPYSA